MSDKPEIAGSSVSSQHSKNQRQSIQSQLKSPQSNKSQLESPQSNLSQSNMSESRLLGRPAIRRPVCHSDLLVDVHDETIFFYEKEDLLESDAESDIWPLSNSESHSGNERISKDDQDSGVHCSPSRQQ
eukprot:1002874_1